MSDTPFVRGARKLRQRINTIAASIDIDGLEDATATLLLRRTLDRFDRQVTPGNIPWTPLAESTIRRKKKHWPDAPMLVRTTALRASIAIIKGGEGSTFSNTGAGRRIGIQDPEVASYAKVQNRGSGRIPARQFLGISRQDIKAVDGLLRRKGRELEKL